MLHLCLVSVSATLISVQPCRQTSKGDGWTTLLRAQLTASPLSLAREKPLLEGESIFISHLAVEYISRVILQGERNGAEESKGMEGGPGKSDQGVESRAKRMSKGLRDHRKKDKL